MIAVSNGSAALAIALMALGVSAGDEVIVPNLTFIATVNAVLMAGATPVLCDVDKDNFCIDIKKMKMILKVTLIHLHPQIG